MTDSKLNNSKRFKLYSHLVILIFQAVAICIAIVITFFPSLGWFVNTKNVDVEGMSVHIAKADAEAEYFVYLYDIKNDTVRYTGEGNPNGDPSITNVDMLFYDTIFKMKNRYTPAVVRIELKKLKKNNGTVKLNIERDTTLPLTESETVGNEIVVRPSKYFSSSMRFTLAQGKGWISDSPSANQLYSRIDSGLYKRIVTDKSYTPQSIAASDSDAYAFEKGDSKIFVTNVNKDGNGNLVGMTKADSVAIKVDYTAADLIDSDSDSVGDTLNVYLYVTYEEELVENFGVSGVGSSGNAQGQIVNLINDISGMTISLE